MVVADAWGRTASCIMDILVEDAEPPVVTCPWVNQVSAPFDQEGVVVRWDELRVSDNNAVVSTVVSHPSGSVFHVGDTLVVATVEDASGNQATCSFNISVLQSADPALSRASSSVDTVSVVAGSTTGVLALLGIAAFVILVLLRRQHVDKAPQNWTEIFALMDQFKDKESKMGTESGPIAPREISWRAIRLLHELGRGAFGVVSQGLLQETVSMPGYMVAVKSLFPNGQVRGN